MPKDARSGRAREIRKSGLGGRAKREGWDAAMFHFGVEHQRAPAGNEIGQCQHAAKAFKADYEACLKGEHPLGGPLARLAEGMTRKARELMGDAA